MHGLLDNYILVVNRHWRPALVNDAQQTVACTNPHEHKLACSRLLQFEYIIAWVEIKRGREPLDHSGSFLDKDLQPSVIWKQLCIALLLSSCPDTTGCQYGIPSGFQKAGLYLTLKKAWLKSSSLLMMLPSHPFRSWIG